MSYKINPLNITIYYYQKSMCKYWNNEQKTWYSAATDPNDIPVPDLYVILVGATLRD